MNFNTENYRLGELVEITSSKRIHMADYVRAGIPFYRSKEVIERAKGNKISTELFISPDQFWAIEKKFGRPLNGDILLTSVGTLGVPYLVKDDGDFYFKDGNLTWMRNFDARLNSKFLYFWLTSPHVQKKLDQVSIGSTQRALTISALKALELPLPSLAVQIEIVDILASLSERITTLRETNATLEAIGQALFKSWFVDFDPVRAKQDGCVPQGMDTATAALFPNSFEKMAADFVPTGWHKLAFTDTVHVIGGGTPKTTIDEYWNGGIPWFSVVDAPMTTDIFVIATKKNITQSGLDNSSTKILAEGTTIISARGTVGRLALVGCAMTMNQSCYGLRGKSNDSYFTYFSTYRLVESLKQRSHGSVFDTITTETMRGVSVVYPAAPVIEAFERTLMPLMNRIKNNLLQTQSLVGLRDALLPRLISGQLGLPEAADQVKLAA